VVLADDRVGAFQVKRHFKDDAKLELIKASCLVLINEIIRDNPVQVHLNYPGIGNGRLTVAQCDVARQRNSLAL
jgi:hypothetical protein